jgi:hypothetical protein
MVGATKHFEAALRSDGKRSVDTKTHTDSLQRGTLWRYTLETID